MTYQEHKEYIRKIVFEYWRPERQYSYNEYRILLYFNYKYGNMYGLLREFDREGIPYWNIDLDAFYDL